MWHGTYASLLVVYGIVDVVVVVVVVVEVVNGEMENCSRREAHSQWQRLEDDMSYGGRSWKVE